MSELRPTFHTLDELEPLLQENAEVLAYWKQLHKAAKVPLWDTFDPLDIAEYLPSCLILKIVNEDLHQVMLVGTRLVNRFGFDNTGSNALDMYPGEEREKSRSRTQVALERPSIIRNILTGKTAGGAPMRSETIVLPFANRQMEIEYLLYSINQFEFEPDQPMTIRVFRGGNFSDYGYYDL